MSTATSIPSIRTAPAAPARADDPAAVIATLVVAFADDPIVRWILPDTRRYLTAFPELIRLLAGDAFRAGTADHIGPDAAAVWVRPGASSDDAEFPRFLERNVDDTRHGDLGAFLEQVETHHPAQAHWYLPVVGVDVRCQSRGLGTRLLRHGLERCDRDGVPAYLEASTERNRILYERHGFETIGQIQAADSPPLWPMLRPAGQSFS